MTTEVRALWRVRDPGYRDGVARHAKVVTLGWDRDGDEGPPTYRLRLPVPLVDEAGDVASRSLAGTQGVPPHLPTVVTRLAAFEATRYRPDAYPLFQRVDLPLADLSAANPALDLARTFEIALVFDQVPEGVVALRSLRLGPEGSPR